MIKVEHSLFEEALKYEFSGKLYAHYFLYTDSRLRIEQGLFWALKGERFDGNDFIGQALENGALGIVTDKPLKNEWIKSYPNTAFYRVFDSTLVSIQKLARLRALKLQAAGVKIVGITGSSGKTTCKEFTFQIAKSLGYHVHSNKGSYNNHFGVPLNILSADPTTEVLICEMGMNHMGELTTLSAIANPNIVCCTMVGSAHIEHFGSVKKIALAKQEIYKSNPSAIGIFNLGNSWTSDMRLDWRGPSVCFAEGSPDGNRNQGVDVALNSSVSTDGLLLISGEIRGVRGEARLAIFGKHHVTNIMAAISINLALGGDPQKIWQSMLSLVPPWGRTQILKTQNGGTLLFDAYNANPESMLALIDVIKDYPIKGRKWAVLGEMKELGPQGDFFHAQLGREVAKSNFAQVVFVGESCGSFEKGFLEAGGSDKNIIVSSTYNEPLAIQIGSMLEPIDFVVIKGSRGMQLERLVPYFKPINFEGKP